MSNLVLVTFVKPKLLDAKQVTLLTNYFSDLSILSLGTSVLPFVLSSTKVSIPGFIGGLLFAILCLAVSIYLEKRNL